MRCGLLKKMGLVLGILSPIHGTTLHEARKPLDNLAKCDRATAIKELETADLKTLWDHFLRGQTELFIDWDAQWLSTKKFWLDAKDVLEIGSGNGAYLQKLAERFPDKMYLGFEKQSDVVEKIINSPGVVCQVGDAEVEIDECLGRFDVVLFRLTLQHLKHPKKALEHAYRYLKPRGHVVIIDSCDRARNCSHWIEIREEASRFHNERNRQKAMGNRTITLELLGELQNAKEPPYKIVWSNLDEKGHSVASGCRLEGSLDRERYFTHSLLYLDILNKGWDMPIDFERAYNELSICLTDDTFWAEQGMHYLILEKM